MRSLVEAVCPFYTCRTKSTSNFTPVEPKSEFGRFFWPLRGQEILPNSAWRLYSRKQWRWFPSSWTLSAFGRGRIAYGSDPGELYKCARNQICGESPEEHAPLRRQTARRDRLVWLLPMCTSDSKNSSRCLEIPLSIADYLDGLPMSLHQSGSMKYH